MLKLESLLMHDVFGQELFELRHAFLLIDSTFMQAYS